VDPEISNVLLVMTGLSTAIFVARLVRTPPRQVADWWITIVVVLAAGGVSWKFAPSFAGYVAFGAMAAFVFVPLRLDRAAQVAARAGRDASARTLSRIASVFHPFGTIGMRPASLRVHAAIRAGEAVDEGALERAGASDPILREWYRLSTMAAAADWSGLRLACALPSRRVRMIQLGFGPAWVRVISETTEHARDVVDAIQEAERLDATLEDADRRALFALEAFAALGDIESTTKLARAVRDMLPKGSELRAIATAQRTAGKTDAARETIEAALARRDLDPVVRRAMTMLRTTLDGPQVRGAPPPYALPLLARLRKETAATDALAPLRDGARVKSYATWALGIAMVAWFCVEIANGKSTDPENLRKLGGLEVPIGDWSQAWRLLSCTFLHAGLLHLGLNLYALFAFGRFVEVFYGRVGMLSIYVASALGSGLAVALLSDHRTLLVGASGAIFGLGGALVAAVGLDSELRASRRGREELKSFAVLVVLQIVFDRIIPAVSGTAHMAGLATGALAGAVFMLLKTGERSVRGRSPRRSDRSEA